MKNQVIAFNRAENRMAKPNNLSFGLSKRKHLPVVKVGDIAFPLWKYRYAKLFSELLSLKFDDYGRVVINELWMFEKFYLPPFSLKNKTVLDIGACCGETAYFYLKCGAKKVICIEPLESRANIILENKKNFNLNIELINDFLKPDEHLSLDYDFIKCDIEGAEVVLLPYCAQLKPCILEAHSEAIRQQFENAGFHTIYTADNAYPLLTNY